MGNRLTQNLKTAFAEASRLQARCEVFALKAAAEGDSAAVRMLAALAESQRVHARRYLRLMRGTVASTQSNLREFFEKEMPERIAASAESRRSASQAGLKTSQEIFEHAEKVQKGYRRLANRPGEKRQTGEVSYHVCQVCGYVATPEAPDRCPVCNAVQEKFRAVA